MEDTRRNPREGGAITRLMAVRMVIAQLKGNSQIPPEDLTRVIQKLEAVEEMLNPTGELV